MKRWWVAAAAALVLGFAGPATAQPAPMPEVMPETPVIRPAVPAPAAVVGTSSARAPAAVSAIEPPAALERTG